MGANNKVAPSFRHLNYILLCPHTSRAHTQKTQRPQSLHVSGTVTTSELLKPSVRLKREEN